MYARSSLFVLVIGFSILIVLIAFLGFRAIRRADGIYRDMHAAQDAYVQTETFRRGIATDKNARNAAQRGRRLAGLHEGTLEMLRPEIDDFAKRG